MAKTKFKTIDEYISSFPKNVQNILDKIRQMIRKEVPDANETISYGIPTFNLNGRYLIYFAAWKEHISVYPTPSGKVPFQEELSLYSSGKGTVKFPLDEPIPYDLVKKIVLHRIKENQEKQK